MQERLARALRWYWGAGTSTAVSVTGATDIRPQDAVIFSAASAGGPASAGAGAVFAALQITALVAGVGSKADAQLRRHEKRSVCRSFMPHPERSEAQLAGSRFVRGAGVALPHFWAGVRSAGPWLKGCRVSLQAQRGAWTPRGEAGVGGGSECGQFCGGPASDAGEA